MNPYLVTGLSLYSIYRLVKGYVYYPLKSVVKYEIQQSRPVEKLIIYYGKDTVVVMGATQGLAPAYCKKLIECGFDEFLLIDDN